MALVGINIIDIETIIAFLVDIVIEKDGYRFGCHVTEQIIFQVIYI